MKPLLSNLKNSAFNNETLKIGGGDFSPIEVKEFLRDLNSLIEVSTYAFRNLSDDDYPALKNEMRDVLVKFED